ncbi:glucose 1-dehydrogenase [Bacillus sp. Marseille-P3661]|uniref:glucose 1-dehydrogenase n=1 Tax=Bacillus sp. Marseille-P3661 TaxID=1936234 RepID=UPI000C84F37F|nr:glucose 1-dehydrogenase [Bacillus sp. Marseille-P3661]
MNFKNQVVVITGSGSGIGAGLAESYADKGAKVVIADIHKQNGYEIKKRIEGNGGYATFIETDVRKPDHISYLIEQTVGIYGQLNILINNAGVSIWKSPYELTIDEWDDIINTNLRSVFLCTREAAKYMKTNANGGSVVNLASTRAFMSEPNSEAYAATKGGIIALTHALALSLSKDKIRVNSISPGWIETGDYSQLREIDHVQHPAQRVGTPKDIARACFYLTDPENDFVTAENIIVDGGITRKMYYEE